MARTPKKDGFGAEAVECLKSISAGLDLVLRILENAFVFVLMLVSITTIWRFLREADPKVDHLSTAESIAIHWKSIFVLTIPFIYRPIRKLIEEAKSIGPISRSERLLGGDEDETAYKPE